MTPRQILTFLILAACLASGPAIADEVVEYYHLDALGNVRIITDEDGDVIERHDYYPFGEECTTGPCATNPGVGAGHARKFTGKERDAETGLDYFGARYYGSQIGRFTTVDPLYTWNDNLLDPQRWNRYSYVRNNPFRYVDPDGRGIASKAVKLIVKGGDVASTVSGVVDDAAVLFSASPTVGTGARLLAAASLTSEFLPVSGRDVKEGAELAVRLTRKGTNKSGDVTNRAGYWKATVQDAWDNATSGPTGGRLCPTCGTEVTVEPFSGTRRDWDVSHNPSWTRREFPDNVDRKRVREDYQEGTDLECPGCNRSRGNRDELRSDQ